jgi:DNA-binding beta-propeller fold protein YncE
MCPISAAASRSFVVKSFFSCKEKTFAKRPYKNVTSTFGFFYFFPHPSFLITSFLCHEMQDLGSTTSLTWTTSDGGDLLFNYANNMEPNYEICATPTVPESPKMSRCQMCKRDAECAHVKCYTCSKLLCRAHKNDHDDGHDMQDLPTARRCATHNKHLRMFCMSCLRLICTLCASDGLHRTHKVITAEAAAAELAPVVRDAPSLRAKVITRIEEFNEIAKIEADTLQQAKTTRDELKALVDKAHDEIEVNVKAHYGDNFAKVCTLVEIAVSLRNNLPKDEAVMFDNVAALVPVSKHAEVLLAAPTEIKKLSPASSADVAAACVKWADSYKVVSTSVVNKFPEFKLWKTHTIRGEPYHFHLDANDHFVLALGDRVEIVDQVGKCLRVVGEKNLTWPTDALVDSRGSVFVTDRVLVCVNVFQPDRAFERVIGKDKLNAAVGLALSADESVLYVAASDVVNAYSCMSGAFLWSCPFPGIMSVAVLSSGSIAAVSGTRDAVLIISSEGTIIRSFGYDVLNSPHGVAVDAGDRLYVASTRSNEVCVFSTEGRLLGKFGAGLLDSPVGVAIGRDGAVFVSELGHSHIKEFRAGAEPKPVKITTEKTQESPCAVVSKPSKVVVEKTEENPRWCAGVVNNPADVKFSKIVANMVGARLFHFDRNNQLIVANRRDRTVEVIDRDGICVRTVGVNVLIEPFDALIDSRGTVFVADIACVQVFQSDGGIKQIGKGVLQQAHGLALSLDESSLYVADCALSVVNAYDPNSGQALWSRHVPGAMSVAVLSSGIIAAVSCTKNCVYTLSPVGSHLYTFGATKLHDPRGIAVDALDRIVVASYNNDEVCVFSSDGTFLSMFGSFGDKRGQFKGPYGVAIDCVGAIFVCDYAGYIQEFR